MTDDEKIDRVCSWILWQYETTVVFKSNAVNEYNEKENQIIIYKRGKRDTVLHSLLHEVGHLLVRIDDNKRKRVWNYEKPGEVLREEVLAWEKGYEFSTWLGLGINLKRYDYHIKMFLSQYVRHFARKLNSGKITKKRS